MSDRALFKRAKNSGCPIHGTKCDAFRDTKDVVHRQTRARLKKDARRVVDAWLRVWSDDDDDEPMH